MSPEHYLIIPEGYGACLGKLRWSDAGDAIETGEGKTFALGVEVIHFLEGFASQRPLIHFAFLLHLLALLRPTRLHPPSPPSLLSEAFFLPGRNVRNAGAFCALLCKDVPPTVNPPTVEYLWDVLQSSGWSWRATVRSDGHAHLPPLAPGEFEARIRTALQDYHLDEVVHWLQEGCGPVPEAGERMAEEMLAARPRSLSAVLAALAEHDRLREAVPFVAQLVSALTLPPRRLALPELPLGGYSDVTTRGTVEHLLPSQLVFEGLDFIRRHAHNELLYFRREEPQQPTARTLIVLLDQGVRTWGIVRVVLAAALFALGQLAQRKHLSLALAATSTNGRLYDPLESSPQELEKVLAASDLSAHPGLALESVLQDEPADQRDVVLLTHPRSLAEPDVAAAARCTGPLTRVFAVTVNDRGETALHQLQHGSPVTLSRFQVDLRPALPPAQPACLHAARPRTGWKGHAELIGYPFRLGPGIGHARFFAFDTSGEWILVASTKMLYLMRLDSAEYEILPVDVQVNTHRLEVSQVLGVAGGFVVVYHLDRSLIAMHYDLPTRTARRYQLAVPLPPGSSKSQWACYYFRKLHTFVAVDVANNRNLHACCHLSTGDRSLFPAATCCHPADHPENHLRLPMQGNGNPEYPSLPWIWPTISLDSKTGRLQLYHVVPAWKAFTPLEDGQPVLAGCRLLAADCQEHALAALFEEKRRSKRRSVLRLFRGPQGIPQASVVLRGSGQLPFVLSSDGRLLARQQESGQLEIRETAPGGRVRCFAACDTRPGHGVEIVLHDFWLSISNSREIHLLRWNEGRLVCDRCKGVHPILAAAGLPNNGSLGRKELLPEPFRSNSRFRAAAQRRLLAVSDCFGQVALLSGEGELVCMFYTQEDKLAAWMPDGTCLGPSELLGCSESPGAADRIGRALLAASTGGKLPS